MLPELRRETMEVPREEVRDRNWSNKLKGKAYADARRGATPKSIRIGDTVLLKAEKSNKLSTNFCPSPFKVVQKTGTEVTVRNKAGQNGKENSSPEKVGQRGKVVAPVPLQCLSEKGGESGSQMQTESPLISQQTVRRSSRIVKKPVRFEDFVLSLRS